MSQIRLCRAAIDDGGTANLQKGPWVEDTSFNRGTPESVVEAGNYAMGPGSHWLECRSEHDVDEPESRYTALVIEERASTREVAR